jgi:hypothetical protein
MFQIIKHLQQPVYCKEQEYIPIEDMNNDYLFHPKTTQTSNSNFCAVRAINCLMGGQIFKNGYEYIRALTDKQHSE